MIATGIVVALFTVDRRAAPMKKVEQLYALAGRGIEGDRYFLGTGTYSKSPEPGRQVTLIKSEVLESLKNKLEINVKPEESRRNILTQGIEINDLIGTEFYVGTVRLRAHRITQPCLYLEKLLDQPGLYKELWDNGGISCEILSDGVIKERDIITAL
jgi:MOSC domain-containing protein YiiM|tara:strand:- start:288 stop:758 length:471 start_codon:yes stop_codon:yes gene_type:complete